MLISHFQIVNMKLYEAFDKVKTQTVSLLKRNLWNRALMSQTYKSVRLKKKIQPNKTKSSPRGETWFQCCQYPKPWGKAALCWPDSKCVRFNSLKKVTCKWTILWNALKIIIYKRKESQGNILNTICLIQPCLIEHLYNQECKKKTKAAKMKSDSLFSF